jgi:hypothetical protein
MHFLTGETMKTLCYITYFRTGQEFLPSHLHDTIRIISKEWEVRGQSTCKGFHQDCCETFVNRFLVSLVFMKLHLKTSYIAE